MSAYNFFSNNLVYVDGETCEIIKSLKNTRYSNETFFKTPKHTVDTSNLMVFADGQLQIKDVDYRDANSYEIEFTRTITPIHDIVIVFVRGKDKEEDVDVNIKWDSF